MGSFKQHLAGSSVAGIACGAAGLYLFNARGEDSISAAILCTFSGLLPDIDCPTSKPADFVVRIFSVLAPAFALQSIHSSILTPSRILLIAVISYLLAIYGIRELIKKATVHRGIIHSVPAALIWGALVFLAFHHSSRNIQFLAAASSAAGFMIHLVIDEMYSLVDISGLKFTPKKSSGTALKLFSHSFYVNFLTYSFLIILLYFCSVQARLL